jgi:hypothetical protein
METNQTPDSEMTQPDARKLPLWRSWIEDQGVGIQYGATYPAEDIAAYLDCDVEGITFAMAILEIRRTLRKRGMNFTGRGGRGMTYTITPPANNADEMRRLQSTAINALKQGVILGTATPIHLLTADEARRHESELYRIATRAALVNRRVIAQSSQKALQ